MLDVLDLDLDLNFTNVWWTAFFLIGAVACMIHAVWTWQRWAATRTLKERRSVQATAFWFFRQDVGSGIFALCFMAAGLTTIVRFVGPHVIHLLEIGAAVFAVNKLWNLFDDA